MSKVAVVYWSGTGNTEAMASAVVDGVREGGAKAELFTASEFDTSMLSSFDAVAFGCPSMGSEQLEDSEFEPMFNSCEGDLGGKKIALFGSYGWGDGEWMRSWEETCTADGAVLVILLQLAKAPELMLVTKSGIVYSPAFPPGQHIKFDLFLLNNTPSSLE